MDDNRQDDGARYYRDERGGGHRVCLTDDDIDRLAERVSEHAIRKLTDKIYADLGKSVLRQFVLWVGSGVVALYFFAKSHGWMD